MKIQILLEDNEQGTVNINVSAMDGAEFTKPESGEEPTNAEAMAASFLQMVQELEMRHKAMLEAQQKQAEQNKQQILTPDKRILDANGNPVNGQSNGQKKQG